MTVITVTAPSGRLNDAQRTRLAETLTDAVLVPEVGQPMPLARVGFQVHFVDLPATHMAIGGKLVSETAADIMVVDVAVMDGDWPQSVRADVIKRLLAALAEACGMSEPANAWWVNFRVIEEGSWGSRGGVLSIHDLLNTGVFTTEKVQAIRAAVKPLS
jgi:phenylpyruvate tautomerase PptA (4-oxalocrotonate tautomerase family)